jgi:predicted DNA-binding transcriptional regulator YafY
VPEIRPGNVRPHQRKDLASHAATAISEPDGSVIMHLEVSSLIEIRRWVLYWGADCQVLEPEELREQVQQAALAILANDSQCPIAPAAGDRST